MRAAVITHIGVYHIISNKSKSLSSSPALLIPNSTDLNSAETKLRCSSVVKQSPHTSVFATETCPSRWARNNSWLHTVVEISKHILRRVRSLADIVKHSDFFFFLNYCEVYLKDQAKPNLKNNIWTITFFVADFTLTFNKGEKKSSSSPALLLSFIPYIT